MHIAGHPYPVMKPAEVDLIYSSSLRILEEMGMEIQNRDLLRRFAEAGLPVDYEAERVRFPARVVEGFIAESQKYDWEQSHPTVSASAGVYHSLYHDPQNGRLVPWEEKNLVFYFSLARQLPQVSIASMLGCQLPSPGPVETILTMSTRSAISAPSTGNPACGRARCCMPGWTKGG